MSYDSLKQEKESKMVNGCGISTDVFASPGQGTSLWSSLFPGIILITGILLFAALVVFLYRRKEKGGEKQ